MPPPSPTLRSTALDSRHAFPSYALQPLPRSNSFTAVSSPLPPLADVDAAPEAFVCPLSQVRPGTLCRVKQLLASPEISIRLREMGFCEQQQIRLLTQERLMICQVCNARLGISSRLAEAILVEPLPVRVRAA
jgi:ferrous iron transport protein A